MNTLVYVEFIDRPRCETYDYALVIVDALSLFCQLVPCRKTFDGEGLLKAILRHRIDVFQTRVKIHSDRDIRFSRKQRWYLNAFRAMGVEVSFGQPYRAQSNRLCERINDEYHETLGILWRSIWTSNQVQFNAYKMVLLNKKLRGK